MRVAVDTNLLAYAEGVNSAARRAEAQALLLRLPDRSVVVPAQVLGELFRVLTRKAGVSGESARATIMSWADAFEVEGTTPEVLVRAADLAASHRIDIWDAVILSTAASSGCRLLLSEDLQDGFTWGGVTVVNPFAVRLNPLLEAALMRPGE